MAIVNARSYRAGHSIEDYCRALQDRSHAHGDRCGCRRPTDSRRVRWLPQRAQFPRRPENRRRRGRRRTPAIAARASLGGDTQWPCWPPAVSLACR